MSWFKNLKIRTKTLILIAVSTIVIGSMVGFGAYTIFQLKSDFSRLDVAKKELALSRGLDRQTHRVWVMVLRLSNIQTILQTALDKETIEMQREAVESITKAQTTQEELDETLAKAKEAQQDLGLLLAELGGEIQGQEALGYNVEEAKRFFAAFSEKSKEHDNAIAKVIEENQRGADRVLVLDLIFQGMAQGNEMINMLIDFNTGLQREVTELERSFERNVNNLLIVISGILAASLLSLGLVFFFVRYIANSIGRAQSAASEIAQGDLDKRLDVTSKDEVGELARSFNQMVDSVIAEGALRKNIIDALPGALFLLDARSNIQQINPTATELLGYKIEEVKGKSIKALFRVAEAQSIGLDELMKGGKMRDRFVEMNAKDGTEIPVTLFGRVVVQKRRGTPLLAVLVAVDRRAAKAYAQKRLSALTPILQAISGGDFSAKVKEPEKEDEFSELLVSLNLMIEDLRKLDRARKEADERKTQFISVVSHQFRTPLSVIRWNAELLEEVFQTERSKQEAPQFLSEIHGSVKFLVNTLENVFDVMIIEGGKLSLEWQPVQLWEILDTVIEDAHNFARSHRVEINFEKGKIPLKELLADPKKLTRIFSILLQNAIEYNNSKGGTVGVSVREAEEHGVRGLSSTIEDRGIGITEADLEQVFEKFFRGENAKKISPNGTGLGLFIVKHFIEAHGGNVRIVSRLNKGTKVSIFLPFTPSDTSVK